jgi:hypothetical protein
MLVHFSLFFGWRMRFSAQKFQEKLEFTEIQAKIESMHAKSKCPISFVRWKTHVPFAITLQGWKGEHEGIIYCVMLASQ